MNVQDHDGWTPLHAAAHWGQREACELLCENYANMDVKNYVGQTCFDVADPGRETERSTRTPFTVIHSIWFIWDSL